MTDDVRKLLGGYATGTLTSDEREALFNAALQDDKLFAALADEQALKDLLEDSVVRAQVLRATEEPRFTVAGGLREWFGRPKAKILAATGLALLVVVSVREIRQAPKLTEIAEVRQPPAMVRAPEPRSFELPAPAMRQGNAAPEARATAAKPKESARKRNEAEADRAVIAEDRQYTTSAPPAPSPAPPPPPAMAARSAPQSPLPSGVVGGVAESAATPPAGLAMEPAQRLADQSRVAERPLRYELLRRQEDGTFQAVANNYEFIDGDVIRVRVTSSRPGAIALSTASQPTLAIAVEANQATVIPSTGGVSITAKTERVVLAFSDSLSAMRPSGFSASQGAAAKGSSPRSFTLEIPIRHRNP